MGYERSRPVTPLLAAQTEEIQEECVDISHIDVNQIRVLVDYILSVEI